MEDPHQHSDRHVLAFVDSLPSGILDQTGWTTGGLSATPSLNAMVSLHEAAHAGLNAGTAWGALLQMLWLTPGQEPVVLKMVERCWRTHEAYATHSSITKLTRSVRGASVSDILLSYPAYQAHWRDALAVGPDGPAQLLWHWTASQAALVACMQSDILARVVQAGAADFTPRHLRDRDSPDSRLGVLQRLAPRAWAAFDEVAAAQFGGKRWAQLRSMDATAVRTSTTGQEWTRLFRCCLSHVEAVLRAAGRATTTVTALDSMRPAVISAARHARGDDRPIILDTDVTSLFDLERLRLRAPLTARVGVLAAGAAGTGVAADRPRVAGHHRPHLCP